MVIKAGERLSVVFRYKTRDITKNLTLDEAEAFLAEGLLKAWRSARLETTGFDLQFERQATSCASSAPKWTGGTRLRPRMTGPRTGR